MSYLDKTVYVYKGNHDVYSKLSDFQKLIDDAIKQVPTEYKDSVQISITTHSCGCYNDYESCIEIFYVCPKTEKELAKEEKQNIARERARIFELEKELAILKKNMGDKK